MKLKSEISNPLIISLVHVWSLRDWQEVTEECIFRICKEAMPVAFSWWLARASMSHSVVKCTLGRLRPRPSIRHAIDHLAKVTQQVLVLHHLIGVVRRIKQMWTCPRRRKNSQGSGAAAQGDGCHGIEMTALLPGQRRRPARPAIFDAPLARSLDSAPTSAEGSPLAIWGRLGALDRELTELALEMQHTSTSFGPTVARVALVRQEIQTRTQDAYQVQIDQSRARLEVFTRVRKIYERAVAATPHDSSGTGANQVPDPQRWVEKFLKMARLGANCSLLCTRALHELGGEAALGSCLFAELLRLLLVECCALKRGANMSDCSCNTATTTCPQREAVALAALNTWSGCERSKIPAVC